MEKERQKIDQIDEAIMKLLAERQEVVKAIAALKAKEGMGVYDGKRELEMRTKRKLLARKLGLDPLRIEVVFEHILSLSRLLQREMIKPSDLSTEKTVRIGVMGGIGSFSEEAALQYAKAHHIDHFELQYPISAENVLKALDQGTVDIGIFPIENSIGGLVDESIQAASQYTFDIQEIFEFNVIQCLHVLPGVKMEEITKVMSHPQALRQCRDYIKKHFPEAELLEASDTAEGARILSQSPDERHLAVIAPKRAGEIYQLETLEEGIQDQKINFTRFIAAKK